jgi:hypothetical protein
MGWAELNIPEAPTTGNIDFDTWMSHTVRHLRDYLGAFHDRGDPAAVDFDLTDLTTDGDWYDLDLSSIVDEDAKAVSLYVYMLDDAHTSYIRFRKNGNSNDFNHAQVRSQVGGIYTNADLIVALDDDQVIEYKTTITTFDAIAITVKGWWK